MTRAPKAALIGAALTALAGLSGCSSPTFQTGSGEYPVWTVDPDRVSGEASATGTLRWIADQGCWVVELEPDPGVDPSSVRVAVVWPRGAHSVGDGSPGVDYDGTIYSDGAGVRVTGELVSEVPDELEIPENCRAQGTMLVHDVSE